MTKEFSIIKYIIKRLVVLVPILIGVSFVVFGILSLMPEDVATIQIGLGATPEAVEKWNTEHGLDKPFLIRYLNYMVDLLHGDFGTSWTNGIAVSTELGQRISQTIILTLGSIILVISLGIPIGVASAVKQYSLFDNVAIFLSMLFTAVPTFVFGLVLILLFALKFHLFPVTGGGNFRGFVLPWITLSFAMAAQLIRMTRSTMLEVIRSDYVQTAKAKGAKPLRIIVRHELKNAMLPMITVIGNILGQTLGGSIITESVFALPGVGTYILQGIKKYDMPVVMAGVLFIAAMVGVINLITDVLYMYIDPRLRSQFVKGYTSK